MNKKIELLWDIKRTAIFREPHKGQKYSVEPNKISSSKITKHFIKEGLRKVVPLYIPY